MRTARPAIMSLALALLLCGCTAATPARPTPPPAPTIPAMGELLAGGAAGEITAIGYLYTSPAGSVLADSLVAGADGAPVPAEGLGVWIEGAPPLPPDSQTTAAGDARYTLVEARGTMEGPGRYGPGGGYAYRLSAPELRPLSVRELTLPLLLQNTGLYANQAVRLRGQLIAGADSAILVERLGPGGVPEGDALQLKLAAPPRDPAVAAALRRAGAGDVRFGPVEITGLWRADRLYPLHVVAER